MGALGHGVELGHAQARADGVAEIAGRFAGRLHHGRGVVVPGHDLDLALPDQGQRLVEAVEVEGLEAQVPTVVAQQRRAEKVQRRQQRPPGRGAAQARLPRPGEAVESRGDAVGGELTVGVEQAHGRIDHDPGPRHHAALERVAVDVDQTGGEEALAEILAVGGCRPRRRRSARPRARAWRGRSAVGMENAAAVEAHALALIDQIGCRP